MALANTKVTGVMIQPVQNVAGFELVNRKILIQTHGELIIREPM